MGYLKRTNSLLRRRTLCHAFIPALLPALILTMLMVPATRPAKAEPLLTTPSAESAAWPAPAEPTDSTVSPALEGVSAAPASYRSPPFTRLDTTLNLHTSSKQSEAVLAQSAAGDLWTAWQSRRQEDGSDGVFGRCLDHSGRPASNEIHVNSFEGLTQGRPVLVTDSVGGWACWESAAQDGDLGGLYARRLGPGLLPMGDEIRINETAAGHQDELTACSDGRGGLVAAWTGPAVSVGINEVTAPGTEASTQTRTLFLRRFDAQGRPLSGESIVDLTSATSAQNPVLTADGNGGFVLCWTGVDDSGKPCGIFAGRFDADGRKIWDLHKVDESVEAWRTVEPAATFLADCSMVMAWLSYGADGDDYGVLARRFDPSGEPVGAVFRVNDQTAGLQNGVALAADPAGGFAVLWNDDQKRGENGRDADVRVRFFSSEGKPKGPSRIVTAGTAGDQRLAVASGGRQAVFTDKGTLAVCWSGSTGDGDESGVHLTMLIPKGVGDVFGSAAPVSDPTVTDSKFASTETTSSDIDAIITESTATASSDNGVHTSASIDTASTDRASLSESAVPHQPPIRRDRPVSKDPYGGDPNPFPLADEGFVGITDTGWYPPDPHMAAGPTRLVGMTNGAIAFFDKDGTRFFQDEIEASYGFWGSVGATGFVFDPEVIYDPHSNRFMAMANEQAPGSRSYFLLAVSDDSDPEGDWHKYRIDATDLCGGGIDSPNIAVDADAVYLTADCWTAQANYAIYILDKTPLLSGNPAVVTNTMAILNTQSHGIPVIYGSAPAMYLIEHFESGSNNSVRLHAITDSLGSPQREMALITVPNYGPPEDPPQMGTSQRPETFDARFWSCVWRGGSLWACHHIDGSRVKARWYEIATNGWPVSGTPELVQSGTVDIGPDVRTFFNSISVDAFGNAAMCYARSSPSEYISMCRSARLASDPLGTMRAPVILKESSGPYTGSRWGDYSGVSVDPADGYTFWAMHEYGVGGSWNTWIASFIPGDNPPPTETLIFTGPGPGPSNAPLTRVWNPASLDLPVAEFSAYGVDQFGVNVASGDIDGDGLTEILTGPGPGRVFGPHVRGWETTGTAISGVSFLAYGTHKYGVNVVSGDIDNDGRAEIITGAGPGRVFGPHVRGWNYDGGTVTAIPGVSFLAYGTHKWGVNVASGDVDGDGIDEIVTGAGRGTVFGPHVRGWNYDGTALAAIPGISFLAYGTHKYGANVACGDLDGDGTDEIITGPGPGGIFGPHVRGWSYSGSATAALSTVNFFAYSGTEFGVLVSAGDVDGDGIDEILTAPGPDPLADCHIRGWNVDGGEASAITSIDFHAYDSTMGYGGRVAGVR